MPKTDRRLAAAPPQMMRETAMTRNFRSSEIVFIAIAGGLIGLSSIAIAQDEQTDMTVVADQVRSQGYTCANPISSERIAMESAPDEPAYLLTCDNGAYEVRLVPDQAAKVAKIK